MVVLYVMKTCENVEEKRIHKFFLAWQHMCNPVDWDLHEENINNSRFNLHHFLEQLYFSGIVLMEIFINKFIPFSPYAPINVTHFFFDEKKNFCICFYGQYLPQAENAFKLYFFV